MVYSGTCVLQPLKQHPRAQLGNETVTVCLKDSISAEWVDDIGRQRKRPVLGRLSGLLRVMNDGGYEDWPMLTYLELLLWRRGRTKVEELRSRAWEG